MECHHKYAHLGNIDNPGETDNERIKNVKKALESISRMGNKQIAKNIVSFSDKFNAFLFVIVLDHHSPFLVILYQKNDTHE